MLKFCLLNVVVMFGIISLSIQFNALNGDWTQLKAVLNQAAVLRSKLLSCGMLGNEPENGVRKRNNH